MSLRDEFPELTFRCYLCGAPLDDEYPALDHVGQIVSVEVCSVACQQEQEIAYRANAQRWREAGPPGGWVLL